MDSGDESKMSERKSPVHVGEAAARVLERLRRTASELPVTPRPQYDCEQCKDTGLISGKQGAKRCPHLKAVVAEQETEKFF